MLGIMEANPILLLVLLPFAGAIAAAALPVYARTAAAWLSGFVMLGGLTILAIILAPIAEGDVLQDRVPWLPSRGLDFALRLDGFSWLFAALVLGIGALVVLYARYYMSEADPVPRFYSFLLAFTGAMLGLLTAGNVIALVVFWELTSLTSFLLISYWYQSPAAREGARTSLIVTAAGGLCLLTAMLMMGHVVGSYDLDRILAAGDAIRAHSLYVPILILFLLGAFTKSAQVPFHFWLPGAMAAPTPVSAFLHSATMVKAGVFLLVRFTPALGETEAWFFAVTGAGMTTLLIGAVIALFQHDLKGLLAYSTISHLGLITALVGIGSPSAILAAIFHIANHAVFKASLFMAAGIIDHESGTRDMRRLNGLIHLMPRTGVLAIVAAGAMGGVPLLNGFLSKEMFFAEAVDWHNGTWLDASLPYVATLASVFSVAYSLRFIVAVFFGPLPVGLPKEPHEPPRWMRRPVEVLVIVCLVVGILPGITLGPTLNMAVRAVLGPDTPYFSIAIWHGLNTPLVMSLVALIGGAALYVVFAGRIATGPEGPPLLHRLRGRRIFQRLLLRLAWNGPRRLVEMLGPDRLQPQLRLVVLLAVAALIVIAWSTNWVVPPLHITPPNVGFTLMWIVGAACAVAAAQRAKYHRFAAVVLLGGAGLITCVTFAWFSAPDLAVTQLLVEIVTTVLLLLGLRWLPQRRTEVPGDRLLAARVRRGQDLVIAILFGAAMAAIAFLVMTRPAPSSIGDWFLRNAYTEGGGTNVVNVILVDFRAFDTFGEITVLVIVALSVFALLRRFRPATPSAGRPEQQAGPTAGSLSASMLVPAVIMQWTFPVLILLAAYLFLRGHDLPGGGFAAGVTVAIAFLLQYLATSVRSVEGRLTVLPARWMAFGLLTAGGTGLGSWIMGYPFLTAHAQYVRVPLIGDVPAATALIFDLGVFGAVVGSTVLMLIAIAHQSLRSARATAPEERSNEGPRPAKEAT